MAKNLADLWNEIVDAFDRKQWDPALRRCIVILQGAPANFEARMKVGDILLKQGMVSDAQDIYRVVAWHFTKAGFPLLAIVAFKMQTALQENSEDMLEILGSLYSVESDRTSIQALPPPLPDLGALEISELGKNIDQVIPLQGKDLAKLAKTLAEDEKGLKNYPEKLPAIPLFSDLPEAAFNQLLKKIRLRRFSKGGVILKQGEPGDSFFILARGKLVVKKKIGDEEITLAQLSDGAVFGEMALVNREPRTASVIALTPVELLEVLRPDLEAEAQKFSAITRALKKFTRLRLLSNVMVISPVFRELDPLDKRELLERFVSVEMKRGEVLIEEGRCGIGLYVVLRGEVQVRKKQGEASVAVALLKEGGVFGEISLLHDGLTTASVVATHDGECLLLSRQALNDYAKNHPQLMRKLGALSRQRIQTNQDLLKEQDFLPNEEVVLI